MHSNELNDAERTIVFLLASGRSTCFELFEKYKHERDVYVTQAEMGFMLNLQSLIHKNIVGYTLNSADQYDEVWLIPTESPPSSL